LKTTATFVTSAQSAGGLPRDGLAEVAMVGRSNVGKSSLINALVRQKIARTSSSPGKTRLANIYRVERGSSAPIYLVDLPGYGYARAAGGTRSAAERRAGTADEFRALTDAYFGRSAPDLAAQSAILLVDSRHPGLQNDIEAWAWLNTAATQCAVVATKIDKLARGERISAMRELESVLEHSVLPVSAVTGEGLDELWILIDELANNNNRQQPRIPRATAPLPPTRQAALRASRPAATTAPRREATGRRPRKKLPRK
jgi:GTP-binding protein